MKTLMRNGRDRRSENPSLGHVGTDQRITSGPVARRPHSKAEYMTAPERFADSQFLLHRGRRPYMTELGRSPGRNLAPQRGADLILTDAICCPRVGLASRCNSID